MNRLKSFLAKPKGITLLGAIVIIVIGIIVLLLIQGSNGNVIGIVTALFAPTLISLVTLYTSANNGQKTDNAAVKAESAETKAAEVSDKVDAVHGLVNGGLEARVANIVATNLPTILREVLGGNAQNPPLLAPSALANPTIKDATNG